MSENNDNCTHESHSDEHNSESEHECNCFNCHIGEQSWGEETVTIQKFDLLLFVGSILTLLAIVL